MTTLTPVQVAQPTDTDLVTASRNGDRDAFGQIVRRYQGMIAGLIYSTCGDIHRSEDLAQETFLSAWKSLCGLREPSKLPSWLCQIARHRAHDLFRKSTTEKVAVGNFWSRQETTSPPPDENLIHAEEQSVVWRALCEIPSPYRETLVLYYRQNHSTAQVAAAMETSEESVRQRLTRGREMLRGQVAELIERNLAATSPRPEFAAAVLAALPSAPVAIGASTSAAAKGSLAAKSGLLGVLAASIGLVASLFGGFVGSWLVLKGDHTRAERKKSISFLVHIWLLVAILVVVCGAIFTWHSRFGWSDQTFITVLSATFSIYWAWITTIVLRHQMLPRQSHAPGSPPKLGMAASIMLSAGPTIGALEWLIRIPRTVGDNTSAAISVVAMVATIICATYVIRRALTLQMLTLTLCFTSTILVMVNWRMDAWVAALRHVDPGTVDLPLWIVNVFAVALVIWVSAATYLIRRNRAATFASM